MRTKRAPPRGRRRSSDGASPDQRGLGLAGRDVAADGDERDAGVGRSRRPRSCSAAPAATTAQSPTRRSTFRYALPECGCVGTRISISISAGPTAVSYGPRWNSSMSTTRSPVRLRMTSCAPTAAQTARQVLGRVGLAERAADRAAVADHGVGDHALGVGEDRQPALAASPTPAARCGASSRRSGRGRRARRCSRARPPADRCRSRTRAWPGAASSSAAGCARRRAAALLDRVPRAAQAPPRRFPRAHNRTALGPAGLLLGLSSATSFRCYGRAVKPS